MCDLLYREDFIPEDNDNRPGLPMDAVSITVHETGNYHAGADAEMHRNFVHAGGGSEQVSFHWVVDDKVAIQLLPHSENGWHAGDGYWGPGNRTSIAVETCVNPDGDWQKTLWNLRLLLVRLCQWMPQLEGRVYQHNHWSGKDCPAQMRATGWFAHLVKGVKTDLEAARQSEAT